MLGVAITRRNKSTKYPPKNPIVYIRSYCSMEANRFNRRTQLYYYLKSTICTIVKKQKHCIIDPNELTNRLGQRHHDAACTMHLLYYCKIENCACSVPALATFLGKQTCFDMTNYPPPRHVDVCNREQCNHLKYAALSILVIL